MTVWKIRKATEADFDFLVNCGITLAFETENKTLDKDTVINGVLNCLNNPKLGCYYVASDEAGNNFGTTMITIEWSPTMGG